MKSVRFWSFIALATLTLVYVSFQAFGTTQGEHTSHFASLVYAADPGKQESVIKNPKAIVAKIHADWCPACRNIAPAWAALEKRYGNHVQFLTLDISTPKTTKAAFKTAQRFGIQDWFQNNKTSTSLVAVFEPKNRAVVKTFANEPDVKAYEKALAPLLKKKGGV